MLLEVRDLSKLYYGSIFNQGIFKALDRISFTMEQGEILGLMGHSGCGKTTAAKIIAALIRPNAGQIWINGRHILTCSRREILRLRQDVQIIFQNPKLALNPNYTVRQQLAEPIKLFSLARSRRHIDRMVTSSMDAVGLSPELLNRYPNEISGGQAQRLAIARAVSLSPKLLIADEATSMLDLSVQAQIIELFKEIHSKHGISILMITHDKKVVEHFCHRVILMEKGKISGFYACNSDSVYQSA
jgi:ABC-type glutathione transport system ATPase component